MDIRSLTPAVLAAGLAFALGAADVAAQTLYKLIDKNGKVTYSEKPPKDFDGKVIRMDIDPNANTATLPKPGNATLPPTASDASRSPGARAEDRVQMARENLEAARKALQSAIDSPRDGELQWIGKAGGGARPVQSEDYQKRLSSLEAEVKKAEEELRVAEQNR